MERTLAWHVANGFGGRLETGRSINTGCRLGECLGLHWSKADLHQGAALIDSMYDGSLKKIVTRTKGKKFRKVPLNDAVLRVLRDMAIDVPKAESPQIFSRIDYEYLSHEKFKRILKNAGLEAAPFFAPTSQNVVCLTPPRGRNFMESNKVLNDSGQAFTLATISAKLYAIGELIKFRGG